MNQLIAEILSQGQNWFILFLRSQNILNLYTFNFMYWFGKQIWKVFKGRYSYGRKYGIHYDGVSKLILNTQKYSYKCLIISTNLVTVVIRYLVKIWHDFYPIFDSNACRSSPTIHFVNLCPLLVIWVFSTQMTNNWFESYILFLFGIVWSSLVMVKLDQIRSNWFKLDQVGSKCSKLIKLV